MQAASFPVMMAPAMVLLPVVTRELRVASRRSSTYWARVGAALVAIVITSYFLWIFNVGRVLRSTVLGQTLVMILGGIAFLYSCSAGLRQSAESIAFEKREGTLGFLFLTDLRGYDIALGKLCGSSLTSFYLLVASFPILSITLMLGGIDGPALWRTSLALVNVLFFANAIGLFVSTFSRDGRRALGAAAAALFVYMVGFSLVAEWWKHMGWSRASWALNLINPAYAYSLANNSHLRTMPFWQSFAASQFSGWLFVALASWRLPWCWQDKGAAVDFGWRARWRQWCYGNGATRAAFRRKFVQINPFFWVISRTRLGPIVVWLVLTALVTAALCFQLFAFGFGSALLIALVVHPALKIMAAGEAAHHFEDQRKNGALEMLLACTPLTPLDIVRGQWFSQRRHFLWPTVAALGLDVFLLVNPSLGGLPSGSDSARLGVIVLATMVMLVADMVAVGWVGMWQSLRETRPKRAQGTTVFQVLFLPWIAYGLLMMFLAPISSFYGGVILWLGLGLALDVILARRSRQLLFKQFRELAATRFAEPQGSLAKLGRWLGRLTAARRKVVMAR